MDTLIDTEQLKALRKSRSWSQEDLAAAASVSLRTIQRIEKTGRCALESKKAIAAAFAIDATELDFDFDLLARRQGTARGIKFGMGGAMLGMLCAYAGITWGFLAGDMPADKAGMSYAAVAAFTGFCCAIIGYIAHRSDLGLDKG